MSVLQPVPSPWAVEFDRFARSIRASALFVAPFITAQPLERLADLISCKRSINVDILTSLSIDNLLAGSTDPGAIASFCRTVTNVNVVHLARLHAKVYVADTRSVIITSSNLTTGGMFENYEYGLWIRDPAVVQSISEDVRQYGELGIAVSLPELDKLSEIAVDLRQRNERLVGSARKSLHAEFQQKLSDSVEVLRQMRAKPGESTNAIFTRTILYLLQREPLSTEQIHPLVKQIHPDICDDSIDRIIRGVRFGKRWKHMVRNAQQSLKKQGLIRFDGKFWHVAS